MRILPIYYSCPLSMKLSSLVYFREKLKNSWNVYQTISSQQYDCRSQLLTRRLPQLTGHLEVEEKN